MSGFVALFNLDGRPADERIAERMLTSIAHRGPDASRVWSAGSLALGHCLLTTTPESVGERQPLHAADAGLSIVFDGRLDNREELDEAFARARVTLPARSDAAFALGAYRCWGDECAAHLLGDFAFAMWDAGRRRLFCARDIMGLKPFYYHSDPRLFLCASEPQALLAHPAISRRPNEGMVGEYLSVVTSTTDTLFADVQRLPPAGRLTVTADGARADTYWTIDTSREIRYPTLGEYAEHLRTLLREAVRARLRSTTGVGVLLSGGVDSSSILGLATSLRRSGDVTTACDAWSVRNTGVADETPFITQVVAKNGCGAHMFSADTFPAAAYNISARQRADVPAAPTCRLSDTLKRHAHASGTRVLFSGFWGDEWFSGSDARGADLFRSLNWLTLAREVRAQSPGFEGLGPGALVKTLTWPLLSRPVRKRIKQLIGRDGVPPWVRPDFARRVSLADRLFPDSPDPAFPSMAQRDIYREVMSGTGVLDTEGDERTAAAFGIEPRHPFADRRVMEFGMAIPEDLRCRGAVRKFILREAMREYLPDDVGRRLTSPEGSDLFLAPMREWIDTGLLREARTAGQGWVDIDAVHRLDARISSRHGAGDPSYARDVWPLWSVLAVEVWMREVVDSPVLEEV